MAATSAEFWDRVARKYSKQAIADPKTCERKLKSTQALMRAVIPVMRWVGMAPPVTFLNASGLENEITAAGFAAREHWTHGKTNSLFLVAKKVAKKVA